MIGLIVRLRSRKTLIAIAGVAVIALLWGAARSEGPDLLKKGFRVATGPGTPQRFWWLGDTDLLIYRSSNGKGEFLACQSDGKGTPTSKPAFTAAFLESEGDLATLRVSPDGTMALWTGRGGTKTVFYEFETGVKKEYRRYGNTAPIWKADSFGWFELLPSGEEYASAADRSIEHPEKPTMRAMFPAFPNDPAQINPESFTATGSEHVLFHFWNGERGQIDPARILACGFGANPSLKGKFSVPAPRPHSFAELRFAPESQRIIWILRYRRFLNDLAAYYAKSTGLAKQGITAVYVTAMGARSSDLIGVVEGSDSEGPANPQVSPGGESLAFLCNGGIWIVPLPDEARG